MIEELWHDLIEFTEQFVVPDWEILIGLIPVGLALLVGLYLTWTVYRFATAGPTRRGKRRLPPVTPEGIHMPGPTFAPVLAAIGAFFLVFGLVAGGLWLAIGGVILVITLLYWGREEMRNYDHIPAAAGGATVITGVLPAPAGAPPAGVHMPPPSFRPLLVALGMTLLVAGLIVGGWLLVVGVIALVITLLGWLWDARREYTETEAADATGHLESGGAPAWPTGIFAALLMLVVVGVVLGSGIIGGSGDGTAAPSGAPPASGAPGGGGASAPPAAGPDADVVVTARKVAWVETELTAPAATPFTLAFDNQDANVPHDVLISGADGTQVFKSEVITGPKVVVYDVPAIPAGSYPFVCTIHPTMKGTLTAS